MQTHIHQLHLKKAKTKQMKGHWGLSILKNKSVAAWRDLAIRAGSRIFHFIYDLTFFLFSPLHVASPLFQHTHALTHWCIFFFAFVSWLSFPHADEIIALISFQLLRFGGIWETFQYRATDHGPIQNLSPHHVILNSCRASCHDTWAKTSATISKILSSRPAKQRCTCAAWVCHLPLAA